jgi:hypothetical protein
VASTIPMNGTRLDAQAFADRLRSGARV